MAKYENGIHVPDSTPVEVPINMSLPETQDEKIARAVAQELSRRQETDGHETLEESLDFDIEDEYPDPISKYNTRS